MATLKVSERDYECHACGDIMVFARKMVGPVRHRWDCHNCGSWMSVLASNGAIYMERWRQDYAPPPVRSPRRVLR